MDDVWCLPVDVHPSVDRERLVVVFEEAGCGWELVDGDGCGDVLEVAGAGGAWRVVVVGEDAAVEDDRGEFLPEQDVCDLEAVDDPGVSLFRAGPS